MTTSEFSTPAGYKESPSCRCFQAKLRRYTRNCSPKLIITLRMSQNAQYERLAGSTFGASETGGHRFCLTVTIVPVKSFGYRLGGVRKYWIPRAFMICSLILLSMRILSTTLVTRRWRRICAIACIAGWFLRTIRYCMDPLRRPRGRWQMIRMGYLLKSRPSLRIHRDFVS